MFKKEEMSFMKKRVKIYKDPASGVFLVHAMDVCSFEKGVIVSAIFYYPPQYNSILVKCQYVSVCGSYMDQ